MDPRVLKLVSLACEICSSSITLGDHYTAGVMYRILSDLQFYISESEVDFCEASESEA